MKPQAIVSYLGAAALWAIAMAAAAPAAFANERHFTYIYETAVLPEGGRELEIWTTARALREHYFLQFDHRAEFEWGLGHDIQTALYLNWNTSAAEDPAGVLSTGSEFQGISSEWKFKLSDPSADALGTGLYAEVGLGPTEMELEAKLLLDKYFGNFLLAYNVVFELEFELEPEGTELEWEREIEIQNVLGGAFLITKSTWLGLEVRQVNKIEHGEFEYAALYAGPSLGYGSEKWWATVTFLAQLPAPSGATPGSSFVLDGQDKLQARLLLAFHY